MNENTLNRIEEKLDAVLEAHNKVVLEHSNRLTKLEAEAGYIKAGFALALTVFMGSVAWAFEKVFGK